MSSSLGLDRRARRIALHEVARAALVAFQEDGCGELGTKLLRNLDEAQARERSELQFDMASVNGGAFVVVEPPAKAPKGGP